MNEHEPTRAGLANTSSAVLTHALRKRQIYPVVACAMSPPHVQILQREASAISYQQPAKECVTVSTQCTPSEVK